MNLLWMTVITALRALRRNLLRSTLTMLGVIIGVAAVVAMVSVGRGADAAVQQQIQSLGNNLLMIIPGATTANGVRSGWGFASTLSHFRVRGHHFGSIGNDSPVRGNHFRVWGNDFPVRGNHLGSIQNDFPVRGNDFSSI